MNTTTGHLIRAATAAGWSYGGRLVGLAWTALLISRLGIGDYGHYALAVAIAAVSILVNFAWLPYYPIWSVLIIAFDFFVIWALTAHGRDVVAVSGR